MSTRAVLLQLVIPWTFVLLCGIIWIVDEAPFVPFLVLGILFFGALGLYGAYLNLARPVLLRISDEEIVSPWAGCAFRWSDVDAIYAFVSGGRGAANTYIAVDGRPLKARWKPGSGRTTSAMVGIPPQAAAHMVALGTGAHTLLDEVLIAIDAAAPEDVEIYDLRPH